MEKKYTFSYETEANSSFLVAVLSDSESVVQYQLRMMEDNEIPNLLRVRKYRQDDQLHICYNVTSKLSVQQVTAGQKMSKEEFLAILKGLAETMCELPEYQMPGCGLVLDESCIFVTPGSYVPSFVYLPLCAEDDGMESLRVFVRKIVLESRISKTNDNFVQRLLDLVNEPALTPESFVRGVEAMCQTEPTKAPAAPVREVVAAPRPPVFVEPPVISEQKAVEIEAVESAQHDRARKGKEPAKEKKAKKDKKVKKEKPVKQKANSGTTKESLIFTVVQALAVLLLAFAAKTGLFRADGGGWNISYIAGALIAVAGVDFVLYRELFINGKSKEKTDSKKGKGNKKGKKVAGKGEKKKKAAVTNAPSSGITVERESVSVPVSPVAAAPEIPVTPVAYEPVAVPVADHIGSLDEDKTEVIEADDFGQGYLEYYDNGLVMRIHVTQGVTRVGSLSQKVDHALSSHKVSKIHAEFIRRGESFYVRDMNSTNGTFINGSKQRIVSNQDIQMHNGDRIRLADVEMVFKC